MYKILIGLIGISILTGCSTTNFNAKELQERHKGIIDACYTVMEYAPNDKDNRIQNYLNVNEKNGHITSSEKQIIIKCLMRTEKSERWSK